MSIRRNPLLALKLDYYNNFNIVISIIWFYRFWQEFVDADNTILYDYNFPQEWIFALPDVVKNLTVLQHVVKIWILDVLDKTWWIVKVVAGEYWEESTPVKN